MPRSGRDKRLNRIEKAIAELAKVQTTQAKQKSKLRRLADAASSDSDDDEAPTDSDDKLHNVICGVLLRVLEMSLTSPYGAASEDGEPSFRSGNRANSAAEKVASRLAFSRCTLALLPLRSFRDMCMSLCVLKKE